MKLELVHSSVVYAKCDAIVNAANSGLQGGAGVCGAIFSSAGWNELQEECNAIGGCRTGHAVMTNGYKLKAKHIIHAVGPDDGNEEKLRQAFYNVLVIADSNNLKTVALVPISTGIYGFPLHKCAQIAIKVVDEFKPKSLEHCYMYCYGDGEYQTFEYVLGQYLDNKNK